MSSSGSASYPPAISAGSSSRMPSGALSSLIRSTVFRSSTVSQVGVGAIPGRYGKSLYFGKCDVRSSRFGLVDSVEPNGGRRDEHEPVAVHGLDVDRLARQLRRVDGRNASRERRAVGPDELDAVARAEVGVPTGDTHGEQASPFADDRTLRARVDRDSRGHALAVA